MIVTAWNNGSHHTDGNGYGLKINQRDRDAFFKRAWGTIMVELPGESSPVEINIDKDSFWNETCRELISVRIGKWLIKNKLTPWLKGNPPRLTLTPIAGNRFRLTRP
jgi:hypothetical protein